MRLLLRLAVAVGLTLLVSAALVVGIAAFLRSDRAPAGTPVRADMRASIEAANLGGVEQGDCRVTLTPGEDIGAAVALQPIGAVVCLTRGVHRPFAVMRSTSAGVVVRGEGTETTIIQAEGYDGVSVTDAERFTLTGVTVRGGAPAGIYIGRARGLTLRDVRVEASGFGVHVDDGATAALIGVTIDGSANFGLLVRRRAGATGDGVRVVDSQGIGIGVTEGAAALTLQGSEIVRSDPPGHAEAVVALDAGEVTLEGVRVQGGNPAALYAGRVARLSLRDVQIESPVFGVHVDDGTDASLEDVTVLSAGSIGLLLRRGASAVAERVQIAEATGAGVVVSETASLILRESIIGDGRDIGVLYQSGADGTVIGSSILDNADTGLCVAPDSEVTVQNTVIAGNRLNGANACGGLRG
jgi:nitrous oxidase accessory protein NosD